MLGHPARTGGLARWPEMLRRDSSSWQPTSEAGKLALEPSLALGASVANPPLDCEVLSRNDMVWTQSLVQQVEFSSKDLKINVSLRLW